MSASQCVYLIVVSSITLAGDFSMLMFSWLKCSATSLPITFEHKKGYLSQAKGSAHPVTCL